MSNEEQKKEGNEEKEIGKRDCESELSTHSAQRTTHNEDFRYQASDVGGCEIAGDGALAVPNGDCQIAGEVADRSLLESEQSNWRQGAAHTSEVRRNQNNLNYNSKHQTSNTKHQENANHQPPIINCQSLTTDDDDDLIFDPQPHKLSRGKRFALALLGVHAHFRYGGVGKINKTLFVATAALLMAVGILLNAFSFSLPGFGGHANIAYMFMYMAGILFGPIYGFGIAFLADLLGHLILPAGAYSPFIGLSNGLVAMIAGLVFMLRFKNNFYKNLLIILFVFVCMGVIASAYYFVPFYEGGNIIYARVPSGRYTIYAPVYEYYEGVLTRVGYTPYTSAYETVRIVTGYYDGSLIYEYVTRPVPIGSRIYEYLYVPTGYYCYDGFAILRRVPSNTYTFGRGLHDGARVAIIAVAAAILVFGSYKILSIKTCGSDGKEKSQYLLKLIMGAILAFVPATLLLTGYGLVFIGWFPNMHTAVFTRLISQPIWIGINVFSLSLIIPALNRTVFKKHPIG